MLDSPPADRPLFEQLYQSGPVGRDQQGHIVELMRLGRLKVSSSSSAETMVASRLNPSSARAASHSSSVTAVRPRRTC